MATASTGWKCTHSASIVSQNNTSATIRVTCYWTNDGWRYDMNNVSAWVYCNGSSYQVKNNGAIDTTSDNHASFSMGYHDFTVSKGTSTKGISCYAKITSTSSYVSGTKSSSSSSVSVSAKPSYKVTYKANGGSGAPAAQTKWYASTLTLTSAKPSRTGHSFQGWATSSTSTTVAYKPGGQYTGNAAITLYAVWKANTYTVSFNANGGTGAPGNQTKTYGKTLTLSSVKPTRTNYNFKGWGTSASATTVAYAAGASYTNNAAVTLYAIWEIAYVKPRITDLKVERCDKDGTPKKDGANALVSFNYECDEELQSIVVKAIWQGNTSATNTVTTATGSSGSVTTKFNARVHLATSKSYTISVTVTDTSGFTVAEKTLNSLNFPIHIMPENKGIAFGKAAELENFADFGYILKTNYGEIFSSPAFLMENESLDRLTAEGFYVIGSTAISETILNKPLWLADTNHTALISVGIMGEGVERWQRYYDCNKTEQLVFQRIYYGDAWGEWSLVSGCTDKKYLTIRSGFKAYSVGYSEPWYRVNGNQITIFGAVTPTAELAAGTADVEFAGTLPQQYRPNYTQTFICQGSMMNRWLLTVKTDGNLYISRYGTTNAVPIPVNAWLTFSITYSI